MEKRIPKKTYRNIMNSLGGGTVPREGLGYIAVGREQEIDSLLRDTEVIQDGGATFRFVVGDYGSGKTFLLQTIKEYCVKNDFMMHVRNLGQKALEEILQKLKDMGLGLGYDGQEQETYTEFNHPGRNRCDQLREIRRRIAKANNIEFEPIECHHTEPCLGTCLMCDYEVSYLDRKLQEKQGRGEKIELKGLMSGKDE